MKIFADHCVHGDAVEVIKKLGHKVERAIEADLHEAFDEQIFAYAQKTKQVLLTFDKDFGSIIRFDIINSRGVVIAYLKGTTRESLQMNIKAFFAKKKQKDLAGRLFIIEHDGVRMWPK